MNKWRFIEAMTKAGFTQRSLAKRIGVSKNTLNNKINGRTPFTTVDIDAICPLINISDAAEKGEIFLSSESQ